MLSMNNQCFHSGKCLVHSKQLKHRARPRFIGFHIPIDVSRPIRAGLLQGVKKEQLQELIVEIMTNHSISYPIQGIF